MPREERAGYLNGYARECPHYLWKRRKVTRKKFTAFKNLFNADIATLAIVEH